MVFILVLSWCGGAGLLIEGPRKLPTPSQWVVLTHYWCSGAMEINVFFSKQEPRNSINSNFALSEKCNQGYMALGKPPCLGFNAIVIVGHISMMVDLHRPSLHLLLLLTTQ